MPTDIRLGTARAQAGQLTTGRWHAFDHPTGTPEELPVMIAQGLHDGPVFWLTANIHGPELTGIAVIHDLVNADLARRLRGTVVAIPSLSPAGFRVRNRQPYFDAQDPNRLFPDRPRKNGEGQSEHPSMIEQVWARLFEEMRAADYLIDLHNAHYQSVPFSIRDKVFYEADGDRAAAEELQSRTGKLIAAFGLPAVFEFSRKQYLRQKLYRSTSGVALNLLRIPAFTAELGAPNFVDPGVVAAAVNGLHNALVSAGMLDEPVQPMNTPQFDGNVPLRRENHPRAPQTGLLRHHVREGERVRAGDIVAHISDIYGRTLCEVATAHDGWVIGLTGGLQVYKHGVICTLAVADDEPLVMKWDEE
ncbi:MAG: succinylglutamate desuccinylase/aspartoacylase family protein [Chloroflexi bacterium]|nr:succinylglutamate desuccinylase/aspartoacylase family protein [Chloroflexota bacterium]